MTESTEQFPSEVIDQFLITEYEHFADSFWRTEELGEKRVNFLISLITAAVAGLVILATSESSFSSKEVQWVAFATGVALLLLGISTLLRMLRRNEVADQYKAAMRSIRSSFSERYSLEGYDPMPVLSRQLFSGGLAQTTALLNSLISGALTAIGLLFALAWGWLAACASVAALVTLVVQFAYIDRRHHRP